jgi:GNAT superfamily N-acetyltransferase
MGVRYSRFEDMKEIAKIKVDGWKTTYKGIIADEYLDSLDYSLNQKELESSFDEGFSCVYENENNQILGFCRFGERQNLELEGYIEYDSELGAIYVEPSYIGQGIGKELFKFVTSELKKVGKSKMILWVLEDNKYSIEFYIKMGGKLVSRKEIKLETKTYYEISFGYDL